MRKQQRFFNFIREDEQMRFNLDLCDSVGTINMQEIAQNGISMSISGDIGIEMKDPRDSDPANICILECWVEFRKGNDLLYRFHYAYPPYVEDDYEILTSLGYYVKHYQGSYQQLLAQKRLFSICSLEPRYYHNESMEEICNNEMDGIESTSVYEFIEHVFFIAPFESPHTYVLFNAENGLTQYKTSPFSKE